MTDQRNDTFDADSQADTPSLGELEDVVERVDTLESTVNHITEQQATLTHQLKEHADSLETLEDTVDTLREEVESLTEDGKVRESRIQGITRSLDNLEEDMQETRGDIDDMTGRLERRLTALENMLDLDERDIAEAVKPNACELEQLSTVPEGQREEEFNVRVQRAIALYEHFHEISTPVKSGGERVLSKDVKTFLNGYSNTDIKYSQVQRVIDSFIEKTDEAYTTHQTDDGRAIIWHPDKDTN